MVESGVVHQDVDTTPRLRGGHRVLGHLPLAHAARDEARVARPAQFGDQLRSRFGPASDPDHPRALRGQPAGDGATRWR